VRDGLIEVVPDNQRTILLTWLENIRDWCISRQLWWGHRIPIWHCEGCKEMVPALDSRVEIVEGHARAASAPATCPKCGSAKLTQDTDVLDTWFSSGLWPFSTLGWPDDTPDLRTFYPTRLLISGYDILFFWDARMIMMGIHLSADRFPDASRQGTASAVPSGPASSGVSTPEGNLRASIPFRRLYLHSLVRTADGAKMSKTKGTGIDPLQMTRQYGTDALRYMLASMAAPGTDITLSEDRILGARAFANKIWNAARFLYMNLEKLDQTNPIFEALWGPEVRDWDPFHAAGPRALEHRWIFSRLAATAKRFNEALESFKFHESAQTVYHFFWDDFCDWYIEWVKPDLLSSDAERSFEAWRNIFAVFDAALKLLHPIMPFITEELWHRLHPSEASRSIALDKFPEPRSEWTDADAEIDMATLQEIIVLVRNIRAETKRDPKRKIPAEFSAGNPLLRYLVDANMDPLLRLASLSSLKVSPERLDPDGATIRSTARFDLRIAYDEPVDKPAEIARLNKEIERLTKDINSKRDRLADETFRNKAPQKVVDDLKVLMVERQLERKKLEDRLKQLEQSVT
jgi:valyl-tRNA synthetase